MSLNETISEIFGSSTFEFGGVDIIWSSLIILILFLVYLAILWNIRRRNNIRQELEIKDLVTVVFYIASLFGGFVALIFGITGKAIFSEGGNLNLFMLLAGIIVIFQMWKELKKFAVRD